MQSGDKGEIIAVEVLTSLTVQKQKEIQQFDSDEVQIYDSDEDLERHPASGLKDDDREISEAEDNKVENIKGIKKQVRILSNSLSSNCLFLTFVFPLPRLQS